MVCLAIIVKQFVCTSYHRTKIIKHQNFINVCDNTSIMAMHNLTAQKTILHVPSVPIGAMFSLKHFLIKTKISLTKVCFCIVIWSKL